MMKKFLSILLATFAGSACTKTPETFPVHRLKTCSGETIELVLINHGSLAIRYTGLNLYVDPVNVKGRCSYASMPKADYIFITHDHFDHFNKPTIDAIFKEGTRIVRAGTRGISPQRHGTWNCCGRGVYKLEVKNGIVVPPDGVVINREFFAKKDFILQAAVRNHPDLDRLYPKSLNTARFITVWDDEKNEPVLFTQFFRCGANGNSVDNWAVGGFLFHLDGCGIIGEDGFFKNVCFSPNNAMRVKSHPESGCVFKGMKLPDYEKGLALCLRAHALLPRLKSIGWDVAFTSSGQILIEGNDDWEISPAQMVNGGLAEETKKYFGV